MKHTLHAKRTFSWIQLPKISILWALIPVIALIAVLTWKSDNKSSEAIAAPASAKNDVEYAYISPEKADYRPFKDEIRDATRKTIESEIKSGHVNTASVYFESLSTGVSYSYNHNDWYTPASLLKVTVLMAYLKKSETDPTILEQKTTLPPRGDTLHSNLP